jgi:hypothetical protein
MYGINPPSVPTITYGGIEFRFPPLGADGYNMLPPDPSAAVWDAKHPIYASFNKPFSIPEFKTPRKPIHVGYVPDVFEFSDSSIYWDGLSVLDMPIKMPGDNTYKVPDELEQFLSTIEVCIRHEHALNRKVTDYYAYLTVDQKYSYQTDGNHYHRRPGVHCEGFQRSPNPTWTEHHYHVVDSAPTEFYPHGFDLTGYDPDVFNMFAVMETKADHSKVWKPKEYEIVLSDCYTVRREPKLNWFAHRTFFRLTYSVRRYNRNGNTWNPMFENPWPTVDSYIPTHLIDPRKQVP